MNPSRMLRLLSAVLSLSIAMPLLAEPPAAADSPVVARVGELTLTEAQMRDDLGLALYEAENGVFNLKRQWAESKARQMLFEQAAKDAKLSLDAWTKKEIESHVVAPAESDIDTMIRQISRGNVPTDPAQLAEIRERAIDILKNQKRQGRESQLYQEFAQKTPVQVLLTPPTRPNIVVDAAPYSPVKGPKDAKVTIVEFTDFQCPWCKRALGTVEAVEKAYPGKVRFVARHFPLQQMHPRAMPAAVASMCAKEQGKFWELRKKLFDNQQTLGDEDIKRYAKEVGLNAKKFEKCISDGKMKALVEQDMKEGQRFGVRGTPGFFVNNTPVGFPQLMDTVKAELEKK